MQAVGCDVAKCLSLGKIKTSDADMQLIKLFNALQAKVGCC